MNVPKVTPQNSADFKDIIYNTLVALGMDSDIAKYATAQAAHETANFSSALFLNYNNAFGMTYVKQSYANGGIQSGGYSYATYKTVQDSCKDLLSWYNVSMGKLSNVFLSIDSLADYVSFLKTGNYFEADETEYLSGCQYYFDKYF